jgi:RecJ-like exonuclease
VAPAVSAFFEPCPHCGGRGTTEGITFVCTTPQSGSHLHLSEDPCRVCAGVGEVRPQRAADYVRGRADREERVHGTPYKTMRERAFELGVDVVAYSHWENFGERWTGKE